MCDRVTQPSTDQSVYCTLGTAQLMQQKVLVPCLHDRPQAVLQQIIIFIFYFFAGHHQYRATGHWVQSL